MADKRTYIRVDDGIEDHPKVMPLSDKAFRLLLTTWGWCSRKGTDGFIPDGVWAKRGTPKVRAELERELVHRPGHHCPNCPAIPAGHVRMHDYLDHQRSADQIADAVEKKRLAGALGNHKRWHHDVIDPSCEFCPPPGPEDPEPPDDGSHLRSHMRSQSDRTSDRKPHRKTSPEDRGQIKEDLLTFSTNGSGSNRARVKRPAPAELAATAHSQTAHRLVETYAATCRKRPPSQVLNDLAVQVDALLAERWTPDELGPVITAWGTKGLNPKLLASVAHEVTNRSPTSRDAASKPSTTDARMAAIQALKHHDHAADHLALPAGANP